MEGIELCQQIAGCWSGDPYGVADMLITYAIVGGTMVACYIFIQAIRRLWHDIRNSN